MLGVLILTAAVAVFFVWIPFMEGKGGLLPYLFLVGGTFVVALAVWLMGGVPESGVS